MVRSIVIGEKDMLEVSGHVGPSTWRETICESRDGHKAVIEVVVLLGQIMRTDIGRKGCRKIVFYMYSGVSTFHLNESTVKSLKASHAQSLN